MYKYPNADAGACGGPVGNWDLSFYIFDLL